MPVRPHLQRFRERIKIPRKGGFAVINNFYKRVNAFSEGVSQELRVQPPEIHSLADFEKVNRRLIKIRKKVYEFGTEGRELYDGFDPISRTQSRGKLEFNRMEDCEHSLHTCIRLIESWAINIEHQKRRLSRNK
ncbi:MAG: hypothetical protein ABIH20_01855 [Candidatus Diapherotrites archaeon]